MKEFLSSFDGTQLFYKYYKGKSPHTFIFLHGVGGNWTMWKKEIAYFQKLGFSTLAFDFRGHGRSGSPKEFKKYRLPNFSRDLYTLIKSKDVTNFVLIGHSLGGGIAINYIMRYPKSLPSSLILIETASTYPFSHNHLLNKGTYLTHFLRFIASHKLTHKDNFSHMHDIDLSEQGVGRNFHVLSHLLHLTPLQSIVKTLDNVEQYVFHNKKRIEKALHNLTIPVLIVAGEYDKVVPPKFSYHIKKLKNDAQLTVLKKAGHKVIVTQPHKVCRLIYNFIRKKRS